MREIHDRAEAVIEGDPRALFAAITDIDRLPEWNGAIEKVLDCPDRLDIGASWTVGMHPTRGVRWKSVSTLTELDLVRLRLSYRTVNANGNPSYMLWHWELTPQSGGTNVSVGWDVYLKTLDRRLLAGPIRKRQLRKEVSTSLTALSAYVVSPVVERPY
jgi:uncharacterized protein YndB with AHSA1/START domain